MKRNILAMLAACGAIPGHVSAAEVTQTTVPTRPTQAPPAVQLGTLPEGIGVPVGSQAPDARLRDAAGESVRLHELFGSGTVLVVFYRGGWCPFCNYQIHELTNSYAQFLERGVTPVAISVDRIEEAARTQVSHGIPFPVLSDPDADAHRAYRVIHEVAEQEASKLEGFGIDLEEASGRDHHLIAVPSMFLVDRTGVVRWAHADPDYQVRPEAADVLRIIDSLGVGRDR